MTTVPERWDKGKWDQAHWDGQLSIEATVTTITLTGNDADLKWGHAYVLDADPATITLTGNPAALDYYHACIPYQFKANPFQITLDGKVAALQRGNTELPPGIMNFGIPRVTIPHRF